ncbi:MAG: ribosome silencing factor [Candidatus Cloacimonetes bacterium]|nr:ribosome silencing factor [Candidatus Cloacimonadota bacterium]HNZ07137.1 ribosome silencing factor [Candidatus Cloacimonadota bacterium]HOH79488.1 ribosome silencing factor [Candidatus Cloacimonadota bacterium]HPN40821.1 ribosome silencing factor [Candidatus Cloacimonadota bacterium]
MADNTKLNAILGWLNEKKAENISVYDVQKSSGYTDVIIVCEGAADLHNQAIANHLLDMAKANHFHVMSKEGMEFGRWVLIDVGDVVVHIFLSDTRSYYDIDKLFKKVQETEDPSESISKDTPASEQTT